MATTDFTSGATGTLGDGYPFADTRFPAVAYQRPAAPIAYQQSLFRFITEPASDGGLGGAITDAEYPDGGTGRITVAP